MSFQQLWTRQVKNFGVFTVPRLRNLFWQRNFKQGVDLAGQGSDFAYRVNQIAYTPDQVRIPMDPQPVNRSANHSVSVNRVKIVFPASAKNRKNSAIVL